MRIRSWGKKHSFSNGLWTTWTKHDSGNVPADELKLSTGIDEGANKKKAAKLGCLTWPKKWHKSKKGTNKPEDAYNQPHGEFRRSESLECPHCGGDLSNMARYREGWPDISSPIEKVLEGRCSSGDCLLNTSSSFICSGSPKNARVNLVAKHGSSNESIGGGFFAQPPQESIQLNSHNSTALLDAFYELDYSNEKPQRPKHRDNETNNTTTMKVSTDGGYERGHDYNKKSTITSELGLDSKEYLQNNIRSPSNRLIDSLILGRQLD